MESSFVLKLLTKQTISDEEMIFAIENRIAFIQEQMNRIKISLERLSDVPCVPLKAPHDNYKIIEAGKCELIQEKHGSLGEIRGFFFPVWTHTDDTIRKGLSTVCVSDVVWIPRRRRNETFKVHRIRIVNVNFHKDPSDQTPLIDVDITEVPVKKLLEDLKIEPRGLWQSIGRVITRLEDERFRLYDETRKAAETIRAEDMAMSHVNSMFV